MGKVSQHSPKIPPCKPSSLRPHSSSVLCEHAQTRHVWQRLTDKSECYSGLTDNRHFTFFIHLFLDFNFAAGRFGTTPELVSGLIWKIEAGASTRRAASRSASCALGTRKGGPSGRQARGLGSCRRRRRRRRRRGANIAQVKIGYICCQTKRKGAYA